MCYLYFKFGSICTHHYGVIHTLVHAIRCYQTTRYYIQDTNLKTQEDSTFQKQAAISKFVLGAWFRVHLKAYSLLLIAMATAHS